MMINRLRRIGAAAILAALASGGTAAPRDGDWSIPARFRGVTVVGRIKGFPHRVVALTFDDGPDRRNTPIVLDALKRYRARATFFLIGEQVSANRALVERMVADGHVIGNHSWSHPYRLSQAEGESQLRRTDDAVRAIIGRPPACIRSPGGFTNNGIAKAIRARNQPNFLWMVSSADTRKIGSAEIARNVVRGARPGDIILMHDGPGHRATANAVLTILQGLSEKGYRFVTAPELCRLWDSWLTAQGVSQGIKPAAARAPASKKSGGA
ncbi:MAG: polysaccharide deacetylase family protein [Chthonomonadales bacterium]|nr:polysaccharide deacetylase family protein [Chthonomonadales bacterium]